MGLINYIRETKGEMKHVSWPTKSQAIAYTILVIVISLSISAYLGLFDWIFAKGVDAIIKSDTNSFDPAEHLEESTLNEDDLKALIEDNIKVQGGSSTVNFQTPETN